MMRMIYAPNGKVVRFEPISGPRLLSDPLRGQLSDWTVKTDARGDELYETLVIAEFRIHQSYDFVPAIRPQPNLAGILRLSVEVESVPIDVVISDPAPLRGFKAICLETKWKLKKAFDKIFGAL
jgi:hypothetical protein